MIKVIKSVIKSIVFISLFVAVFLGSSKVLNSTEDYRNYQWIHGFYCERENSLDAVYVGSSSAYAYWNAPLAWHNYGITVYPFTSSGQTIHMVKHFIAEARKTQPNALYLINMNVVGYNCSESELHFAIDYMPVTSINRIKLIKDICKIKGYDEFEFIFPIYRFHTRWSNLNDNDWHQELDGFKGAATYPEFLNNIKNVSSNYSSSKKKVRPDDTYMTALDDLLEYCSKEKLKVLFVYSPQGIDKERRVKLNYTSDYISKRGYDVFNMFDYIEKIGMDFAENYYNSRHTNYYGCLKTTDLLAKYLVYKYKFPDKRGKQEFSDWDKAYTDYQEFIKKSLTDNK